jgi:hypothetical protein
MDSTTLRLMMGAAGAANPTYVEDVFSTYLYTGNNSTQTITNGIDLSGKGGLVWFKGRTAVTSHFLQDSAVGWNQVRKSNTTDSDTTISYVSPLSNGFTWYGGSWGDSGIGLVFWTFRKAEKFFDVVTYTGNGASSQIIPHSLKSQPGFIIVKRTDSSGNWAVDSLAWSTDILGGNPNSTALLNSTAAFSWTGSFAGPWCYASTSTDFYVYNNTTANINGATYVAYLFASDAGGFGDTGNDSVIKCGVFSTNGSGNATVNLGWEPQWLMVKDATNAQNWYIEDSMRGFNLTSRAILFPNLSNAEATGTTAYLAPSSTGFSAVNGQLNPSSNYVYIAIRRGPMKTPTDATKVFDAQVATPSAGQLANTGFPVDFSMGKWRTDAGGYASVTVHDRLRGYNPFDTSTASDRWLKTAFIFAENSSATSPQPLFYASDRNNGLLYGSGASSTPTVGYFFRRAPGFFDVVAYTGTGSARTVSHNLGVTPELMIVKKRSANDAWVAYANNDNTDYLVLNTTAATVDDNTIWNDTSPTSYVFTVGTNDDVNGSTATFIAYLFASCPGVSKVGSYTGTGTTLQINCGFAAGARFVMIKRTDSTGDWYVWDTARGIVSGNDSYLLLNSTAAEVTNTDYIDPLSSGFEISSTAPAAINANGGSFLFLAVA